MKRMIAMVLVALGVVNVYPGEMPERQQASARLEGKQEIRPVAEGTSDAWNALDVATEGVVSWTEMAGNV